MERERERLLAAIPSSAPRSAAYEAYLNSELWQRKRLEAFEYYGRTCTSCGASSGPLDVHHRHYLTLEREGVEDLDVLCRGCHEAAHSGSRPQPIERPNREGVGAPSIKLDPVEFGRGLMPPALGSAAYSDYVSSKAWRAKREKALEYYGRACRLCGSRTQLEVHHITYENLGREEMMDLDILCHSCHAEIHLQLPTL